MLPHACRRLGGIVVPGLLFGLFAGLCPAEPAAEGYTPVVPVPAVHAAVRGSLKTVEDWLDREDFLSAAQYAQGLEALAQLYVYQGSEPAWREKAASLAEACARLGTVAKAKDATACAKQVTACRHLLDDLVESSPGDRVVEKKFKPLGGNKTWMLLMDEAVSEGLTAKTPRELEQFAGALAEEANAAQYLRADARWRQSFREVRAAALEAAAKAKVPDLDAARASLKTAYKSCQACHDTSRK